LFLHSIQHAASQLISSIIIKLQHRKTEHKMIKPDDIDDEYTTGCSKKTDTQFYFWDNFGNSAPILTILSLLQAEIYGA